MPVSKTKKKKKVKMRREWSRCPVQKPHSSKKGKKGYSRAQEKQSAHKEIHHKEIKNK